MRTISYIIILLTFLVLSSVSCGSTKRSISTQEPLEAVEKTKKIKLIDKIIPSGANATFEIGENVKFTFDEIAALDSVKITVNKEKVNGREYTTTKTGINRYKIQAYKDGKNQTVNGQFTVLADKEPKFRSIKIVNSYPHDPDAYTQGLIFHNGKLYESTGERGTSSVREVEIRTGKVLRQHNLGKEYFGEGLALLNNKLYQLTWEEGVAFVYNINNFNEKTELPLSVEGWGLTTDGSDFYITDGSSKIFKYCGTKFCKLSETEVVDNQSVINYLNELEWVNGRIWANIYTTEFIAVINPETGVVEEYIDCRILPQKIGNASSADVFNGIAYDEHSGKIWVTGKDWDTLFEIEL